MDNNEPTWTSIKGVSAFVVPTRHCRVPSSRTILFPHSHGTSPLVFPVWSLETSGDMPVPQPVPPKRKIFFFTGLRVRATRKEGESQSRTERIKPTQPNKRNKSRELEIGLSLESNGKEFKTGSKSVNGESNRPISEQNEESNEDDDDDDDPTSFSIPVCRVVTYSDSKLPTSTRALPKRMFEAPNLARKLDDIYHSIAHDETRRIKELIATRTEPSNVIPVQQNNTKPEKKRFRILNLKGDKSEPKPDDTDDKEKLVIEATRASLEDAGFELLSRRDLDLCEALNTGYLLRLSILPDTSQCEPDLARSFYPERFRDEEKNKTTAEDPFLFDGRVLVYWRGYSQEVTRGRLLLPKLDYLQASIVQRAASFVRDKLNVWERWISFQVVRLYRSSRKSLMKSWAGLVDQIPNDKIASSLRQKVEEKSLDTNSEVLKALKYSESGRWFKLARYGGSKIRFVGSSDPSDALNPFIVCEQEPSTAPPSLNERDSYFEKLNADRPDRNVERDMYYGLNEGVLKCPYDVMATRGKSDTLPPMQLLKRVTISSLVDPFSADGRRSLLQSFFAKSELIEPTYDEVIVVWRPSSKRELTDQKPSIQLPKFVYDLADMFDFVERLPERVERESSPPVDTKEALEIRSFTTVPMANLPAVLPKTKLIFRPADALVFDFVSIISGALVIGSQRFDNPRLDLIALVSVSLWIIRTILRYSNKLARYDLLVKTFLTSKISHRNMGAIRYVATEAGSQRAVRAALVHLWLSQRNKSSPGPMDLEELLRVGSVEVNELLHGFRQIPVDIEATISDLRDLGLVKETNDGKIIVVDDSSALLQALKDAWNKVFDGTLSLKALVGRRRREE